MPKTDHLAVFTALIAEKSILQKAAAVDLAGHLVVTYESLKPLNILKSTLKEARELEDSGQLNLKHSVRLISRYLFKKVVSGNRINQLTGISGIILELIITQKMMVVKKNNGLVVAMALKKLLDIYSASKTIRNERILTE